MNADTNGNSRFFEGDYAVDRGIDRRRHAPGLIYEGDGGTFSQTWWPVCRSTDLTSGQVLGSYFLDGRIAIYRGESGTPHVVSAYCAHNGADLGVGHVAGEEIVCAFHRWRFGAGGRCTGTGSGDPVPPRARLFHYPTIERFGLVWAFNGEEPQFELPDIGAPDEELAFLDDIRVVDINVDPWIFMCNALDFNHIRCVHGVTFHGQDPDEELRWSPHRVSYRLDAEIGVPPAAIRYDIAILGTNIYLQYGVLDDRWFSFLFPCGLHRPGTLRAYVVIATRKGDGSAASAHRVRETLEFGRDLELGIVNQDLPILNSIRFTRGAFTRSDKALGRLVDHFQRYPRAHPGATFIR